MRKQALTILILFFGLLVQAQRIHVTAFGGFSNYQGDLQDKRFTLNQSHPAVGAGLSYELTDKFYARANFTYGKLSGDDKQNPRNSVRNLNFTSSITDIHLGLEYYILNPYQYRLTPYIFAGISRYNFNPYTSDTNGRRVYLKPLSTEGQGFYQNRQPYKLSQFAIPFGCGFKFSLSENIQAGVEAGLRKTNTDYIDDVSTTYVDQALLYANRGQKAVDMAFRGDELKANSQPYPADGTQRGSAKNKDWYYFTGITLTFRLNGNQGMRAGGGRTKTGCPTNVR